MGEDGDGVAKHPQAATHNKVSGAVNAPVVLAGSITGGVVITTVTPTQSEMDKWTEGLAQGVRALWQREKGHRKVHDPAPLPVRWHPAAVELTDHWANIRRLRAGATAEPLALTGSIERLEEIYRSIPSGRLVLLGKAGAGKTVLAAHLALDLLTAHRGGQLVPVIVSVGSWNPKTTPLHVWLAEQLARDHHGLATPVQKGGPTRAAAVIAAGRVLPILDGFDEIDPGLHEAALRELNTIPDAPMVITSRVTEYTAAVHGVDVLTAAAVIELDDLTVDDLADYLPRTAAGPRTGIWDPILERLRAEPHAPGPATLRQVLANPLMVFLARAIYSDTPNHDPRELLDTNRFPAAPALQDHLLTEFVPAVYQTDQPDSTRRWTHDRAHRHLTYLASHLRKAGTRDLAWWQLRDTIPRWHRTLIFAVGDGLAAGLTVWLTYGLTVGLVAGLALALASGLTVALTVGLTRGLRSQRWRDKLRFLSSEFTIAFVVGLLVALVVALVTGLVLGLVFIEMFTLAASDWHVGFEAGLRVGFPAGLVAGLVAALAAGLIGLRSTGPQPTRTRLQIRGRARFIAGRFMVGLVLGLTAGLVLVLGLMVGSRAGLVLVFVLPDVLAAGLVAGLAVALAFGLEAPVNAADVVTATESLARDRRNTIRKMLAFGPVAVLAFVLTFGFTNGLAFGSTGGLPVAVVVGFVSVRASSAWIYWLVLVRVWLPLTGRLPWRVQTFLTDAYQRGVLRQTGAVYQFRHARLQDHLTAETPAAIPATDG